MFRHYRVFLRELVINTLPSYTSISNADVGNTVYNYVTLGTWYWYTGAYAPAYQTVIHTE